MSVNPKPERGAARAPVEFPEAAVARTEGMSAPRRWLYVGLAGIFVGLALLGVVLPGLPTTPFLLVASYLLVRSSPALHRRLLRSRTFGPTLRDWHQHKGLRKRTKRFAIVACAGMISISVATGALPWPARLAVVAVGIYGISFVARLPVVPESDADTAGGG